MKKACTVDIDGILNYYPQCWMDFVGNETGELFKSKEDMKEALGREQYKRLKDAYRKSDFKADLPVREEGKALLRELESRGYEIIIVTTSPFKDYPDLRTMTGEWLKKNGISHKMLGEKTEDFIKGIENLEFHLDDELKGAELVKGLGYRVFLFVDGYDDCTDGIVSLNRLEELLDHID